jgi:hypothetical protein
MSVFRCRDERLIKGRAHSIIEENEKGQIIGTYTGYWNPDFRTVTLYPDYRHPAHKAGRVLRKQRVYDGEVRCGTPQMRNEKLGMRKDTSSTETGTVSFPHSPILGKANSAGVKNATAGIKKLPFVQERMKF